MESDAKQKKSTELAKVGVRAGSPAKILKCKTTPAGTILPIPRTDIGESRQKVRGGRGGCEGAKMEEMRKEYKKGYTSIGTVDTRYLSIVDALKELEKDLEIVKKAKEKLKVEVEEKTSRFNFENEALKENLEALKKELEIVEAENKKLKRILERLSCDNDRLKETVGSMQEENAQLKEDMEKLQKEHGEKLEKVETENAQLKEEMGKLKKEHGEIRTKLDCKDIRLSLGQVAWLLEQEIWKNVLPGKAMGTTRILNSMERWLKKNSQSEEGKAAQKRWDELKSKLNWDDDDHRSALKILKDLRVEDAHPPVVDLEEARKQLNEGDYVAESDKESCQDIIDMITKARSIN